MPKLTVDQELRAQFMEIRLNQGPGHTTMQMMLQVDAIVRFITTGQIEGLPDGAQAESRPRRPRQSARTTH